MKLVSFVIATCLLLIVGGAAAADLHPIVEVQTGYLFGANKRQQPDNTCDESSPAVSDASSAAKTENLRPSRHATIPPKMKNDLIVSALIRVIH